MNQDVDPEALKNDEQLKKALAEVTPRILVDAIDELLLVQRGEGARLQAGRRAVQGVARRNSARSRTSRTTQKFQAALKQEGMTIDDLRKNVERQILIAQVQREEVGSKLSITEEEARQYYAAHPEEFTEPASVTLREILIEVPTATQDGQAGVNVAQDDEAREARRRRFAARVLAARTSRKVAAEVSASPSKANGGLIGPIAVSELSEPLQKPAGDDEAGRHHAADPRRRRAIRSSSSKRSRQRRCSRSTACAIWSRSGSAPTGSVRKCASSSPRVRGQAIIEWKNDELKKVYEQLIPRRAQGPGLARARTGRPARQATEAELRSGQSMKIGSIDLAPPFALAPMAGMTDTAFRRLVKRHGGCGLVVTEMVSSEGLVRGIDRTLEYAEYTEEERPVSIQIFGGDPEKMAAAAQIVEGMGADIVDVNMGCPVPKIAKHNAGCSLMREPAHAAGVVARDGAGPCRFRSP